MYIHDDQKQRYIWDLGNRIDINSVPLKQRQGSDEKNANALR